MCLSKNNPNNHQFIDDICKNCGIIRNRMVIRDAHFRNHIHLCTIDHIDPLSGPIRINIPVFNHEVCDSPKCQTCKWYRDRFPPNHQIMNDSRIAKIIFETENNHVFSIVPSLSCHNSQLGI